MFSCLASGCRRAFDIGVVKTARFDTSRCFSGRTHVYYVYGMQLDLQKLGKDRDWIVNALKAEGVTGLFAGYQNIHLLPIFRNRIAYGVHGFPWKGLLCGESEVVYGHGLCPVAEQLHAHSFFDSIFVRTTSTNRSVML